MRHAIVVGTLLALPGAAGAQAAAAAGELGLPAQLASAVAPLPAEFRESATVLGHADSGHELVVLRAGAGPFICLADRPGDDRFHAACYHASLEPFMARGRELRAQGIDAAEVDTLRYAEVLDGRLEMPRHPAALYSLTGGSVHPETGEVTGARPLYVVYIAFATAASTGLPTTPVPNAPWLMFPGTPKAHIMFIPDM
jgi:hypothetical protein